MEICKHSKMLDPAGVPKTLQYRMYFMFSERPGKNITLQLR